MISTNKALHKFYAEARRRKLQRRIVLLLFKMNTASA